MSTREQTSTIDPLVFGSRLRHARTTAGLTLAELGARVGRTASYLSMVENGRREPKLSLIGDLAAAVGVGVAELLAVAPPTRRAQLEIELERSQSDPLYRELGLPYLKPTSGLSDAALEHIVTLFDEVKRRSTLRAATPEEARKANAALRAEMRERGNYFGEIEAIAAGVLEAIGYERGPVSSSQVAEMAAHFGFSIQRVGDLPGTVRSVTDMTNHVIYIAQRDELDISAARPVVLQTLGHFALGHDDPVSFGDFLRQRVEANYFAGALLAPEAAALDVLQTAKRRRDLSIDDLRDQFGVSYEMAAHRFTNLATEHLGIRVHFTRSDENGIIWKAYENDDVPYPRDPDGAIEGQRLCRQWATRRAFQSDDRFVIHYQYTDTPTGTFFCSTHVEVGRAPVHAITVGVRFDDAKWFRGRETPRRSVSRCPDESCCRRPPPALASRWHGRAWPSARAHSHVLAALPSGTFPGVDLADVYDFLERRRPVPAGNQRDG